MKFLIITTILILGSTVPAIAQIWQKSYGIPNREELCMSSYIAYDEGLLLGCRLNEKYNWLVKTDKNGEVLFTKTIKPYNYEFLLSSINEKANGGILLTGAYALTGPGGWGFPNIISLNDCGELVWCKIIDIEGYGFRIKESNQDNIILYTRYASVNSQEESNQLWGIDPEGRILWYNQIVPDYEVTFNSALVCDFSLTSDKGFLLSGYCYYPDPQNPGWDRLQPLLVKTDSIGNAEWIIPNSLDTNNVGVFYSCIQHNDAYYAVGDWYGVSDTVVTPWFNKFSLEGNELISTILHSDSLHNMLIDIDVINDTSLVVAGRCTKSYLGFINMGVFTTDTLGNLDHSMQTLSGSSYEECLSVTPDSKIYCTGYSPITFYSLKELDAFAIKLNASLEYDSLYTQPYNYDSLCPYPIVSDTLLCNCEPFVSIKEIQQGNESLTVLPNPASGRFTILLKQPLTQAGSLQIYDMMGRIVYHSPLQPGSQQFLINCAGWLSGLYFIRLRSDGKVLSGKALIR